MGDRIESVWWIGFAACFAASLWTGAASAQPLVHYDVDFDDDSVGTAPQAVSVDDAPNLPRSYPTVVATGNGGQALVVSELGPLTSQPLVLRTAGNRSSSLIYFDTRGRYLGEDAACIAAGGSAGECEIADPLQDRIILEVDVFPLAGLALAAFHRRARRVDG